MDTKKFQDAFDKLFFLGQDHLLNDWDTLSIEEKNQLVDQILEIDSQTLFLQQENLKLKDKKTVLDLEPFTELYLSNDFSDINAGKILLKGGRVGCIIVAGGQATRLGLKGTSKGCVAVSKIKNKSLFQLFAEKTLAASKFAKKSLPIAIMTSPLNDEEVRNYFEANHYFGLEKTQVSFFSQGMLPFLDENGKLFLENGSKIVVGPEGNGLALHYFYKSEAYTKWQAAGIKYVNFIQVDNALADPFDINLIGFHAHKKNEVTVKCCERLNEKEKVGLLVKEKGHCSVVEYFEFPQEKWSALNEEGTFLYSCANLSLFCFNLEFIKKFGSEFYHEMPLHPVKKMGYKFERFIFDVLSFSDKTEALLYPREECFAPLKNSTGPDSIESVAAALQARDIQVFGRISGLDVPSRPFELSQEFYYPTDELLQKWQGQELPTGYDYIEEMI